MGGYRIYKGCGFYLFVIKMEENPTKYGLEKVGPLLATWYLAVAVLGFGLEFFDGYREYRSGFTSAFKEALYRNADLNGDGMISYGERGKMIETLNVEVDELREKDATLQEIIQFLNNR